MRGSTSEKKYSVTKAELLCSVTSGVKLTQDFINRTSYQHGGSSVIVWACLAVLPPGPLTMFTV